MGYDMQMDTVESLGERQRQRRIDGQLKPECRWQLNLMSEGQTSI